MAVTKILLVDDDDLVRSTLDEVLQQEGFDVTTAASVPEALKYITSNVYDVLLSDLHMPEREMVLPSSVRCATPIQKRSRCC